MERIAEKLANITYIQFFFFSLILSLSLSHFLFLLSFQGL